MPAHDTIYSLERKACRTLSTNVEKGGGRAICIDASRDVALSDRPILTVKSDDIDYSAMQLQGAQSPVVLFYRKIAASNGIPCSCIALSCLPDSSSKQWPISAILTSLFLPEEPYAVLR